MRSRLGSCMFTSMNSDLTASFQAHAAQEAFIARVRIDWANGNYSNANAYGAAFNAAGNNAEIADQGIDQALAILAVTK